MATTQKKRKRSPGVHFYPSDYELEALAKYGREQGVSLSFLASEMFHHGFDLWKAGEFVPQPTAIARAMFASCKTARGGD